MPGAPPIKAILSPTSTLSPDFTKIEVRQSENIGRIDHTIASYISDNFKYDLTIVNETKNGINNLKHEIEIELLITSETLKWASEYINDFLECKIYDLVNIVEPIDRDTFKIKLF